MSELLEKAKKAKQAALDIASLPRAQKDEALMLIADALERDRDKIIAANRVDMQNGERAGFIASLLDRLMLDKKRISDIAEGVRQVAALDDPVGEVLSETKRPSGLTIKKVRTPVGVIGIIYEARPNVTVDCAALALKTGNSVVLRGSSSAINSNIEIVKCIRGALEKSAITPEAVQIVEDTSRESAAELMHMNKYLDLLIPRGGASLINDVVNNSTVPIIETGIGNCHIYIDESAKLDMVLSIAHNSKTQRPSVCNAAEKILIHKNWPLDNVKTLMDMLSAAGVELRCCDRIRALFTDYDHLKELPDAELEIEYLDMIIGIKMVEGIDEAVRHINIYGSHHTDAIVTEDTDTAQAFLNGVDSASVNHNASTRFTDGWVFGFGAEIGISTQKLHARGPMGLPELTSYKYIVLGDGQIRE